MWQFLLVYGVLGGIGFAGSGSLAVTVLVSRWYVERRTAVFRWVFLGINAGQLTLVPLGGLLIEQAGYRAAYVALGALVLVARRPGRGAARDRCARARRPVPGRRRTARPPTTGADRDRAAPPSGRGRSGW